MPWDWPVNINYHEAKAFATWKTAQAVAAGDSEYEYRITTEAEHHLLRDLKNEDLIADITADPPVASMGTDFPELHGANLNLAYGSESAVDAMAPSKQGFHDVIGNVWHWVEDHMSALTGFRVDPLYDDFTLPCFDGEHHMILGGSFASTGDEASHFARFHFRPHFHQHAGFRLVRTPVGQRYETTCLDNQGPYVGTNPFRTSSKVDDSAVAAAEQLVRNGALHSHYADDSDSLLPQGTQQFQKRIADYLIEQQRAHGTPNGRAVDLGCGVGRATLELSKGFDSVLGLDVNSTAIEAANTIVDGGEVPFSVVVEGVVTAPQVARCPPNVDPTRVTFRQMDALCLEPALGAFDAVLLSNTIEYVMTPESLLGNLGGPRGLVASGGLLVIASPYTWLAKHTPQDLWLGGFEKDGAEVSSAEQLKLILGENFQLVDECDMPVAVRQTARSYQYSTSHVTVWKHN